MNSLFNVYGLASHQAYSAEPAELEAEREARRWGEGPARLTVHCHSPARAIRVASRWVEQRREAGAGRLPAPGEEIRLHILAGVPVLVPPPRMPGEES